jgi:hypothetical protein
MGTRTDNSTIPRDRCRKQCRDTLSGANVAVSGGLFGVFVSRAKDTVHISAANAAFAISTAAKWMEIRNSRTVFCVELTVRCGLIIHDRREVGSHFDQQMNATAHCALRAGRTSVPLRDHCKPISGPPGRYAKEVEFACFSQRSSTMSGDLDHLKERRNIPPIACPITFNESKNHYPANY